MRRQWQALTLTGMALGCAALAVAAGGVPRFAAGLLLSTYLPGRLAVAALLRRIDRPLRLVLSVSLSFVVTALVGFVLVLTDRGFAAGPAATGIALWCAVCGGIAWWRGTDEGPGAPAGEPAEGLRVPPRAWLAALPAVALTLVLVGVLVEVTRHRTPESYYTELALEPPAIVTVHSREKSTMDFRFEVRVAGTVTEASEFALQPDERRSVQLSSVEGAVVEVRLYRAGGATPYRRLLLRP